MNNLDQYEFERYIPTIRKVARKYAGYFNNDHDEAFAEFSLKVYEFILKHQAASEVVNDALVYTTCKNHAISYLRKELAYKRMSNRSSLDIDELAEFIGIKQEIEDSEHLALIKERALLIANDKQRELIELRLSDAGLTYTAIAKAQGTTVSAVTKRAKTLHKRYLKQYA